MKIFEYSVISKIFKMFTGIIKNIFVLVKLENAGKLKFSENLKIVGKIKN